MRDPIKVLEAKAKKCEKTNGYIDDVNNRNLSFEEIPQLKEPAWLKNALHQYAIAVVANQRLSDTLEAMRPYIKVIDTNDYTKYQVFKYTGPERWIGSKFAKQLKQDSIILIKNRESFYLGVNQKEFAEGELSEIVPYLVALEKMDIETYKSEWTKSISD